MRSVYLPQHPAVAYLCLVRSMAARQPKRIGVVVLLCIAVGLLAAALFAYTNSTGSDWWTYSRWARRWILLVGLVAVGILCGVIMRPKRDADRTHTNRDVTRKT